MVTVAIVAILATVAFPLAQVTAQRSKEQDLRHALRQIRSAIDEYKQAADEGRIARTLDQSGYPPKLAMLVEGVHDTKSPTLKNIYFLRSLPRDPMSDDSEVAAKEIWGLRSYASPPDEPQQGDDVFDVYSLNPDKGLNGVPYRDW